VEFVWEITRLMMPQGPAVALGQLCEWANRRYGLGWTPEALKTRHPNQVREELLAASRAFIEGGKLAEAVAAAQACATDDELERHLRERYNMPLPEWMRYLEGQERLDAIRARVETVLRAELTQFEQTILLQTLDHLWKDHLHGMDQLRDVINFRAYSQQDPRTEFKREGARTFVLMMESVRDRITDDIFKVRMMPAPMNFAPPRRPPGPAMAGSISGPGLGGGDGGPEGLGV
jgi:preprotein translocase subunit SecA